MKSILMSIRPEWCEKIANGKKTIEVRKTRPKIKTPFKVYIYCTRGKNKQLYRSDRGFYLNNHVSHGALNGKIIGEFVCFKLEQYAEIGAGESKPQYMSVDAQWHFHALPLELMAMDYKAFAEYAAGRKCYGWHISDLKIYDCPEELCAVPPQSWYYVESE